MKANNPKDKIDEAFAEAVKKLLGLSKEEQTEMEKLPKWKVSLSLVNPDLEKMPGIDAAICLVSEFRAPTKDSAIALAASFATRNIDHAWITCKVEVVEVISDETKCN